MDSAALEKALVSGKGLYFGHLLQSEHQYRTEEFIGLTFSPKHDRELLHNLYKPLPVRDGLVAKIQSQDVFEHLEYDKIPELLDEVFRALRSGGIFRLSIPDYRSPVLKSRSAFDAEGNVIADLGMGNMLRLGQDKKSVVKEYANDGSSHLWFPTYEAVMELVIRSRIRKCEQIKFYHYYKTASQFVCEPFPENGMPVYRCPPFDTRANGMPISIIVDFIK
jgi:hypothetical protein